MGAFTDFSRKPAAPVLIPRNAGGIIPRDTGRTKIRSAAYRLQHWEAKPRDRAIALLNMDFRKGFFDRLHDDVRRSARGSHRAKTRQHNRCIVLDVRQSYNFYRTSTKRGNIKLSFFFFLFFSGKGGGSEVGSVVQGATAGSSESAGLLPAAARWKSALRVHPRARNVLRRSQIRASQ